MSKPYVAVHFWDDAFATFYSTLSQGGCTRPIPSVICYVYGYLPTLQISVTRELTRSQNHEQACGRIGEMGIGVARPMILVGSISCEARPIDQLSP